MDNWRREAARFTPGLRALAIDGPDRAPLFAQMAAADLVITSYALLRRDVDRYQAREFGTVILDEAHHIKNPDSQVAQAACALRSRHRFVLTGTPMENSVRDLWSIMRFALPGYLGSRQDFRERYEQPLARPGDPAADAVRERIEACGCRLVFLPRYSPDFNPIEGAFSKLKGFLRRVQARTREALDAALGAGLQNITALDARGWFKHCGYSQTAQPS